jgi:Na+/alanine symporter
MDNTNINMYKNIQRYATIIYLFYFKISTCFGYLLYPSSGVRYCSWQLQHVILMTANCSIVLLMIGTTGTRNM